MRWGTAIQAVVPVGQGVGEGVLESTRGEDGPEAGGLSRWVWTRVFLGQERVGYRSGSWRTELQQGETGEKAGGQ